MEQMNQAESRGVPQGLSEASTVIDQLQESAVRCRIDPRTGKQLTLHDASFWREHDAERRRRGQSIVEYCAANGLAVSTFRRWAARFNQETNGTQGPGASAPGRASFLAVPIHGNASTRTQCAVEVVLGQDVSVKLAGEAAARVLETVFARLGATR